jgi:hypothetical protein
MQKKKKKKKIEIFLKLSSTAYVEVYNVLIFLRLFLSPLYYQCLRMHLYDLYFLKYLILVSFKLIRAYNETKIKIE